MTARGGQTITLDYENRPVQVNDSGFITTFVYDGDGNRGKRTEGAVTTLYINKYFEKRVTAPASITTYYYFGGRTVATRMGETLEYIHQDNLVGTSVMSNTSGNWAESVKYYPFGAARSGSVSVSRKFTGQILEITGLYYYGARYYDPTMGRFISADSIVPHPANPQSFNRYSYVLNNPLIHTDPTGHECDNPNDDWGGWSGSGGATGRDACSTS